MILWHGQWTEFCLGRGFKLNRIIWSEVMPDYDILTLDYEKDSDVFIKSAALSS